MTRVARITADRPEGHPWIEIDFRYPLAKEDDNVILLMGEISANLSGKGYKNIGVKWPGEEKAIELRRCD